MNEMIDMTLERDVSEEVIDHEMEQQEEHAMESELPSYAEVPENGIVFHSMDCHHYLIDRNAVDWEQTAANKETIENNLFVVRQQLMNIMLLGPDGATEEDTEFARTVVKDIVIGIGCTPKYTATFPEASHYTIAQMYCIDAIEIMHLMLKEIAIFNMNKSIADCLNLFSQEDETHED